MSNKLVENLGELNGSVKNYVQVKIDLVKLTLLSKLTRLTTFLVNFLIVVLFVFLVIGFGATAFAVWYGQTYNNYFGGLLISGVSLIVLMLIFVLLRRHIITTTLIRNFAEILLEEEEKQS
ncbi:MAG: hypothetical protein PHN68_02710 [Prolixibacteraceae bacterium]|jgi:hypothetical protein|nr:hypothetical protein [Prolixibacteraceae bacterium]MDD4754954.1 hypothetical protein [Prolixibacteraceae bacterium]NLO01447.1 hypothetical protein [Bacteroidales bacterium]